MSSSRNGSNSNARSGDSDATGNADGGGSSSSKRKDPPPPCSGTSGSGGARSPKRSGSFMSSDRRHEEQEEDGTAPVLVRCDMCGHDVPRMNLGVHSAVCRRRVGGTTNNETNGNNDVNDSISNSGGSNNPRAGSEYNDDDVGDGGGAWEMVDATHVRDDEYAASTTRGAAGVVPSAPLPPPEVAMDLDDVATTSTSTAAAAAATSAAAAAAAAGMGDSSSPAAATAVPSAPPLEDNVGTAQAQWSCPRCTLLNPTSARHCDACLLPQPGLGGGGGGDAPPRMSEAMGAAYRPDLMRRRQQQRQQQQRQQQQQQQRQTTAQPAQPHQFNQTYRPSPAVAVAQTANSVLSGAVIGSVFGGAVGALVGAAAGGIMDGMTRWNNRRAASAANNGAGGGAQQQRQQGGFGNVSYSSSTIPGTGMRVVTIRSSGPITGFNTGGGGFDHFDPTQQSQVDQMILRMLMAAATSQGVRDPNQMSYEELLQHFGAGTENQRRGAEQGLIDAIPLITIREGEGAGGAEGGGLEGDGEGGGGGGNGGLSSSVQDQLGPNIEPTCGICLEDFGPGDEVRLLTCRHAFHRQCGDRWLRQVASCPICKREVEDLRGGTTRSGTSVKEEGRQEAL